MKKVKEVYEVTNPSFGDMNLDQQIEAGINDWVAIDIHGREYFGETKAKAISYATGGSQ